MNLFEFCYGIIHWLVDLANHLWYWLGDHLPWVFGDFFNWAGDFAASHGHIAVMAILVEVLIMVIIALVNVLNLIWIDRKWMGRMFDFYGPYYVGYRIGGWLQNLADGIKLFVKEIITPSKADKVGFLLGPIILVGSSFLALATIGDFERWVRRGGTTVSSLAAHLIGERASLGASDVGLLPAGGDDWVAGEVEAEECLSRYYCYVFF